MLDRSKPYAEVHGLPGVVFEQDSQYYDMVGNIATPKNQIEEVEPVDDGLPLPYNYLTEQSTLPVEPQQKGDTLEDMHWRHLKALVESYGGEWNNKEKALEFLRGKK